MFILSEYYLNPGYAESHTVLMFNDRKSAEREFRRLVEETKAIFPYLQIDETNAHWEDTFGGEPRVYDLAFIETRGTFVRE